MKPPSKQVVDSDRIMLCLDKTKQLMSRTRRKDWDAILIWWTPSWSTLRIHLTQTVFEIFRNVKFIITPQVKQEPTKLQNPSTTVFIGSSEKDTVLNNTAHRFSSQPKMGSPIRQDLTVQQKSEMIFLPSTMFSTVSDQSGELDDQVGENRLFEEEHQNLPPKLALTKSLPKSLKHLRYCQTKGILSDTLTTTG